MTVQFKHPFTKIIGGPSGCGKTTYTVNFLNQLDRLVDVPIVKILWCYTEENALATQKLILPAQRRKISYHRGLPDTFENRDNVPMLIILDDLMAEANSSAICELFTKGSHHRSQSIILITQNIFHKGAHCRDISLNAKYIVVFSNPRDKSQFNYLARQVYPENPRELIKIYKEVTDTPHNYLLLDLTQGIHDSLRFRTDIFNENYCVVYCCCRSADRNIDNLGNETIDEMSTYAICPQKRKSEATP